jgi:RNA polymerase sigma-70 factor (ECF subfamily)
VIGERILDQALERDLVQRAQAGDNQAFGELVEAHQKFAYNLALRGVGDTQDAEDIVQEAFVRAWKGLAGYRVEARFRTWLYRIVINLCYSQLPRLRKDVHLLDAPNGQAVIPDKTPESDPETLVASKEVIDYLQEQIQALSGQYQILLLLRHREGCSYAEIAQIMDLPLGTVKTGIHRARKQLKEALVQDQEEWLK